MCEDNPTLFLVYFPERNLMQGNLIDSFIVSLTRAIDLMRLQKNPSKYKWDIQNLDKIRFYFAGLIDEKEELLERFFQLSLTSMVSLPTISVPS